MSDLEIVWTKVDEAPALATFSLLPIVEAFVATAGVKMKLKDISLTGRIIANFPDKLTPAQKIDDELAELRALLDQHAGDDRSERAPNGRAPDDRRQR